MEDKDLIIDELLSVTDEKEKNLKPIKNPDYLTNMSFSYDVIPPSYSRVNIHSLKENQLIYLMAWIDTTNQNIKRVLKKKKIKTKYDHFGFTLDEWYRDSTLRYELLVYQREVKELKLIRQKLKTLMSDEKKEMIEILQIKKLLGL